MPKDKLLSPREKEILQLAATGLTNREIAQTLSISPNTVKVHMSNIFEKTGVTSRTEAALYGMEHGLVAVPGGEAEGQPDRFSVQEILRKYFWVWMAMLVLVAIAAVSFTMNIVLPSPEPETVVLDDAAERWQELTSLPEGRSGMAVVVYDGDLYTIGGEGQSGVNGGGLRYIADTDHWEKIKNKPTPVMDVQGALIGEKIYIPGGRLGSGQPTDVMEIYDPREDAWEKGAAMPKPISAYAMAAFEGQLFVFGGWDGQKVLDEVYIYDPVEGIWHEGSQMSVARQDAGAVALPDKIIVLGGRNDKGFMNDAQAYFPSRDIGGEDPWRDYVALPEGRYDFGVTSISDNIYVLGGQLEGQENQKDGLLLLDEEWIAFPVIQDFNQRDIAMVSSDSLLVIFDSQSDLTTSSVWTYQAFYYSIYIPFVP